MFGTDMLSFREFAMREALPLSSIHHAVLTFLRDRDDVVLFGAQAVNAYVDEPRMTQDVDLLSPRASVLAEELRDYLHQQFQIAIRIREVSEGKGFRIYQVQKSGNRHLVDLRLVAMLPAAQRIGQVLVLAPTELIVSKVISYYQRRGKPKSGTDWRDLALLLLTFPELKRVSGAVAERLAEATYDPGILALWQEVVATEIVAERDEDEFAW